MTEKKEKGFQTIGSLVSKIAPTQPASGSTPAPSPSSSATTGTPGRALVQPSSTGRPPGAPGAARTPSVAPTGPEALDLRLEEFLKQELGRSLVSRETDLLDPVYGWVGHETAFSLVGPVDPGARWR
jgi:hypothetical protein